MTKRSRPLEDQATVVCPWCGSEQELEVDPETLGKLVQDCAVCCRPWDLEVRRDGDGRLSVALDRAD